MIVRAMVERDLVSLQFTLIPETAIEKGVLKMIDFGTTFMARRNGDDEDTVVLVPFNDEKAQAEYLQAALNDLKVEAGKSGRAVVSVCPSCSSMAPE